ncbi:MAG: hypothetical protein HZA89_10570 [Verrucomicrobia bacterium]|nr:hypothetical protein [Verrucomicrobiota bacterium]
MSLRWSFFLGAVRFYKQVAPLALGKERGLQPASTHEEQGRLDYLWMALVRGR